MSHSHRRGRNPSPDCEECRAAAEHEKFPKCKECDACLHCVGDNHKHHSDMNNDAFYFRRKYGSKTVRENLPSAPLAPPSQSSAPQDQHNPHNSTQYAVNPASQQPIVVQYPPPGAYPGAPGSNGAPNAGPQYINGPQHLVAPSPSPSLTSGALSQYGESSQPQYKAPEYTRGSHFRMWEQERRIQEELEAQKAWELEQNPPDWSVRGPGYINGPNASLMNSGAPGSQPPPPPPQATHINGPSYRPLYHAPPPQPQQTPNHY